jgi:phage nucleotide-binding protein
MSLISKPSELLNKNAQNTVLAGLIYGEPGVGKTTMALSAPNPLLIDFDNGLKRVNVQYQKDSVQIKSYKDLIDVLQSTDLENYDTIVIDTLGKLIDKMGDYLSINNPKIKQSDGTLGMKGWGSVKIEFQRLLRSLTDKNKSVIFVAHAKEDKEGETTKKRPDVPGSSGKDVIKELDFMGYMSIIGGKRTIDLMPNECFHAKNSIGIDGFLEFSKLNGVNDFLTTQIFEKYSSTKAEEMSLRLKYDILIEIIDNAIDSLNTIEDVNDYYKNKYQKLEKVYSSYEYERAKMLKRTEKLGFKFNKESKVFE